MKNASDTLTIMSIRFGNEIQKITVQTRKRRDIDNQQFTEISPFELSGLSILDSYRVGCIFRNGVSPIYNCHGMTFASRRTGIFESDALLQILSDDGYERIDQQDALPGDIIIYWKSGDIEHSGIVVEVKNDASFPVLRICSKWGKGPEVVHPFRHCPYSVEDIKFYRIQSWTKNSDSI